MTDAELRRRLADVKLRSTLKDSQLTPDLLKKRQFARRLKQPVVEGSSQTYADMARERKAAEELQFGPQQRSLQAQAPRDAGWFDSYLQSVREAQARQQAQAAQVAGQIQQFGQAGLAASQQAQGQLEAQMAPLAAAGGATVDPSIANVANQASLVRQAMVNSMGANVAANSLAQGDLLRTRESAGGLAKLEHQGDLSRQLAGLLRERGAFGTDFESKFKDNAQKTVLENQAFGLKQDQEAFDQEDTLADNARLDRNAAMDRVNARGSEGKKYGYSPYQWLKLPVAERRSIIAAAKKKTGKGSTGDASPTWSTSEQQRNFATSISPWLSVAKRLGATTGASKAKRAEIAAKIMGDPKTPGELATRVILDRLIDGHLSPETVRLLHKNGIKVGPLGVPTGAGK